MHQLIKSDHGAFVSWLSTLRKSNNAGSEHGPQSPDAVAQALVALFLH